MSLAEKQRGLIEDLNLIPDIQERLGALTAYAARMKYDPARQTDDKLVPGCVSRVWLHGELLDGTTRFVCEADSPMVKALAAVLCDLYTGATPAEVVETEPEIWTACQFTKMLSPTRLNGLASVRRRIHDLALQWRAAE
ncbi:MAG: SufE family protein [Verrucomicrobiaceae bacterium]|jgi:cysteine desulfuration protein SufE|nr:SufE family protein [Verrucomicrobiaceae bacterium]